MNINLTSDELLLLMQLIHDEIDWWNDSRADSLQKFYEASNPDNTDFQDWLDKSARVHDLENLLSKICFVYNDSNN